MTHMQFTFFALLFAVALAGVVTADVTMQAGPDGSGSVYTTGNIYVSSAPAGASAILDGGHSQLFTAGTFRGVEPGTHQVLITLQGFQPYTTTVKVSAGATGNVIATLPPVTSPGGISVSSTPRGAGVYVDDIYMGKTNQVVGNLAAGPHRVVVSEAGYVTWEETVQVRSKEVIPVAVTLVAEVNAASGDLLVSSTPTGASVYIDGNYRGSTPVDDSLDINDLSPGTYTISVKKPGYQEYATTITLQAGRKVQVFAPLTPAEQTAASVEISSTPAGADVFVNNLYMGITPLSFHDVSAGTYTVDIRMEGYVPFSSSGQVIPGQSVHVIAALSPVQTPAPTTKAPTGALAVVMAFVMTGIVCLLVARR